MQWKPYLKEKPISSTAAWRAYLPSWTRLNPAQLSADAPREQQEPTHETEEESYEDEEASGRALCRYRELSSFEMRARLKESVCRIEGRGVHGSGFLIEYRGMVGVLTVSSLLPDKDTARTCAAIFHTAKGERVQVALLPESMFFTSPERSKGVPLDYTFVACEDSGPHIHALILQRSRAPTVAAGDSVQIMLRDDAGETALSECRVVRVKSPYVFYYAFDAENITTAAGTLVLNGYEPVALHRHRCPASVTVSDSLISALACAPPRNPSAQNDAEKDYVMAWARPLRFLSVYHTQLRGDCFKCRVLNVQMPRFERSLPRKSALVSRQASQRCRLGSVRPSPVAVRARHQTGAGQAAPDCR